MSNLSYPLREQRKYDEAISVLEEAISIASKADGDQHPLVSIYKTNLARVYLARGEWTKAESLLREAIAIRRRVYVVDDWRTLSAESMLGEALTGLGRYHDAESLLLHANSTLKDQRGARASDIAATRRRLAALYDAQGETQKAAPYRLPQK